MKRNLLWVLTACAMAGIMVLAACAPATVSTTSEQTGPATGGTTQASTEKPKYGGTYTEILTTEPAGFDALIVQTNLIPSLQVTQDTLLGGDWTKGPAGTGETDWQFGFLGETTNLWSGQLATSWEIPDDQTIIYHIRKGVHWMNGRAGDGRELTAADVAWSIQSEWQTPGTNFDVFFKKSDHLISATATDQYTVELKVPPQAMATNFLENSEREFIRDPDVTKKYGNQNDWHNMDTTGPFYITDYVPSVSITYAKNPNYWEKNPIGSGKGDQLPYVDGVKQLIIMDTSTQLAAFRTAKVDLMKNLAWEDGLTLQKQYPSMKWIQTFGSVSIPTGRVDKANLPFKDLRVRQALNLAVNKQAILDGYYQGHAELLGWPFYSSKAYAPFYTPLNQMPTKPTAQGSECSVQELFTYNPDKAKQLLAEAGYPNGFKTTIAVSSAGTSADFASLIKADLAKVGVDMEIQVLDPTTYTNELNARTFDQMILRPSVMYFLPYEMHEVRADSSGDASFWQDDQSLAVYQTIEDNLARNDAVWVKALKDVTPHLIEESWGIFVPAPYIYDMWWPWVKNFHGEVNTGYARFNRNMRYLWIDQDLKKSMGY